MHYFSVYLTTALLSVSFLAAEDLLLQDASDTNKTLNEINNDQIGIEVRPLYNVEDSDYINLQESKSQLKKVDIHQQDLAK